MEDLKKYWDELWISSGLVDEKKEELFNELMQFYNEEHRSYHTFLHIKACLQYFQKLENTINDSVSFRFAIFYHDAIYDTRASNNEEESALLATKRLEEVGLSDVAIKRVSHLILLTKNHSNPISDDDKLFLDIDLSILGESGDIFDAYEKAIREEYSWVPLKEYKKGRGDILRKFLSRDRLYFSDYFFNCMDDQARNNLRRSLVAMEK